MIDNAWRKRAPDRQKLTAARRRRRLAICESLEKRLLMSVIAGKNGTGVLVVTEGSASDAATITGRSLDGTTFTVSGTGISQPLNFTGVTGISVSGPAPALAASVLFNTAAPTDSISLPGGIGIQFVSSVSFVSQSIPITAATVFVNLGSVTLNTPAIITTGQQAYIAPVTLAATTTLKSTGSGNIVLAQPVNGAHDLTVNTGGTAVLSAVGTTTPLSSLTATGGGSTSLGNITTVGTQAYTEPVTLTANSTVTTTSTDLNSGVIVFSGEVDGAFALTVNTQFVRFAAPVGGATPLTSITINPTARTAMLAGRVTTTGAQTWAAPLDFQRGDITFTSTNYGNISFNKIDGAFGLIADTGGTTTFGAAVGGSTPLTSVTTDAAGATALNGGTVKTTGAQTFNDAVILGVDANLTSSQAGNISFVRNVDGAHALTVNTAGVTAFESPIGSTTPLNRLTTDGPGSTALSAFSVITTGDQMYADAFTLDNGVTVTSTTGGNITFGKIDGAKSLTVSTSGTKSFNGPVGADTPLAAITIAGSGSTTINTHSVQTTGSQVYRDPVTLALDTTLTAGGSSIEFDNPVDGGFALAVNAGSSALLAAIGSAKPLASLTLNAPRSQFVVGSITTVGSQSYLGALILSTDTTLTSTANADITFASSVDELISELPLPTRVTLGPAGLNVNTGGTTIFNAAVGATNPLRFLQTDAPGSTVIAGPGVTTTGSQTYADDVRLGSDATLTAHSLQLGTTIQFGGTLDGAHSLTLDSSSSITFSGPVGATTPLSRLNITHGITTLGGGSITTGGAQNYVAVLLSADSTLSSVGAGPNDFTFMGPVQGAHALTISAGNGNIAFNSPIGAATPLTKLTLGSANNVTASSITADSISQLAGIGATAFTGLLRATGPAGITLSGHDFSLADVTPDKGSFTLTDTGIATVAGSIRSPAGGLTKAGPGTLDVGISQYVGPTNVTGGTLEFDASQMLPGGLHVGAGATAVINTGVLTIGRAGDGVIATTSVTFDGTPAAPQGQLDLRDEKLILQFGNMPDPSDDVRKELAAGFHGGDWAGQGIVSSAAAKNPSQFALGFADGIDNVVPMLAPGNLLVKFAMKGDVNLDGKVDFSDLLALAQHFGQPTGRWDQGDLNYDGTVSFSDLLALAQNFGTSLANPVAASFKRRSSRVAAGSTINGPAVAFGEGEMN